MSTLAHPAALAALLGRLERLTPSRARRWGTISAHQMLCHVGFACEAALGRVPFTVPMRRPNRVMKWFALSAPFTWPHNLKSGSEPGQVAVDEATWWADVARVIAAHRALAAAAAGECAVAHPIFGPMSSADWQRWAWLHTDHHLRQFGA